MNTSPASANRHTWHPGCDLEALRRRGEVLAAIRAFFDRAGVLEVETPQLWPAAGTDPHLDCFPVQGNGCTLYLQTSPEFAMKRLLAAGAGSIYQICKAFRRGEAGRLHNPEFTLLEWYRVGFDLSGLMEEVACLLRKLLEGRVKGQRHFTYAELFQAHVGVSWEAPLSHLQRCAEALGLPEAATVCDQDRGLWLDLLFSHAVQPRLPEGTLVFVRDYPAPLAALARFKPDSPWLVDRFEVFVNGIELANGYQELTDPVEQRVRFDRDLAWRRCAGLPSLPVDEMFLAALDAGLPQCCGVAVGIDRVLMLVLGRNSVADVLAFPLPPIV